MSTAIQSLVTSVVDFAGGAAIQAAYNEAYSVSFSGAWAANDNWTIILTETATGLQTQVGYAFNPGVSQFAAQSPGITYAFTYANKQYVLGGQSVYFSAIGEGETWNDPNASGDSFVNMSAQMSMPENLTAMATYQGQLVFFSRRTAQIWVVDANPANWQQVQVFSNIGALAPASVQSVGDLDVLFLSDSGVRSLRARVTVLNAFVADVGSPIDDFIQTSFQENTAASNSAACAIVEPTENRYWLYLNGTIYVWSAFPSNKIEAWSTYLPTYQSGNNQVTFTPTKFVVFQGQVYALGTDNAFYQYGGNNNTVYDNCIMTVQTPFHDLKSPTTVKTGKTIAVDAECDPYGETQAQMTFQVAASDIMNPTEPEWGPTALINVTGATFDANKAGIAARGSHFAVLVLSSGTGPAVLSEIALEVQ